MTWSDCSRSVEIGLRRHSASTREEPTELEVYMSAPQSLRPRVMRIQESARRKIADACEGRASAGALRAIRAWRDREIAKLTRQNEEVPR